MSKTKTKRAAFVRYDEAKRKKIAAFLKNHTNQDAKEEFGCSAHFAAKVRDEFGVDPVKKNSPKAAPAKGGKPKKTAKNLL